MRVRALLSILSGLFVVHATAVTVLPPAMTAVAWMSAASDPVRLADLGLAETATPERIAAEIETALSMGDADLAASFVALADARDLPVEATLREAVEREAEPSLGRIAAQALNGAVFGTVESPSGLAGAVAGDLVGIGDVRDFTREGWRAIRGEEADEFVLALSAVGLAVTGATWVSFGAPAPARVGLTAVKAARRAGRLSPILMAHLARVSTQVVDRAALAVALRSAGRLEATALRRAASRVVRLDRAAPLLGMAEDSVRIGTKAGLRTADDVLALAHSPVEIRRAARLADHLGPASRATLKLLGRGALVLTRAVLELVGWIFAALGWAFGLACATAAFGRWLARVTRPRRRTASPFPKAAIPLPAAAP